MPPGCTPADVRCAVFNIATLYAIQEALLQGRPLTQETADAFARAVLEDIHPRDSWRASKAFREHIAVEMARRGLIESWKLAGGVMA